MTSLSAPLALPPPSSESPCGCRAHSQHRLLKFRYFNPSATLKDASATLHVSYGYARLLWTRLRRRKDFGRLCPLCFEPALFEGGCRACGFEPGDSFVLEPEESNMALDSVDGWASPVHRILPDRGLGSELTPGNIATLARGTMYHGEKIDGPLLRRHASNLSHLAEVRGDALVREISSIVMQELKSTYPEDGISDLAARLVLQEVRSFRANYPQLRRPRGLKDQLAANVIRRVGLIRPPQSSPLLWRNSATPDPEDRKE